MRVGMLWLDARQEGSLESRVEQAASYYREKYGQQPDLCYVNPSTEGGQVPSFVGRLRIRTDVAVQPAHFWLGVHTPDEGN